MVRDVAAACEGVPQNLPLASCLGDFVAPLVEDCSRAYATFVGVPMDESRTLQTLYHDVHASCVNLTEQVRQGRHTMCSLEIFAASISRSDRLK
jgi:hypothetical protein